MQKQYEISSIPKECYRVWGRTTENTNSVRLFWTGAALELCVRASELSVEVNSDYDIFENWIDIVVNDTPTQRILLPKGRSIIPVFRGRNPKECKNVRIIRDTQAMGDDLHNRLEIVSVLTDGVLEAVAQKPFRLEFIGDSITSGEGCNGAISEQDWIPEFFSAVNNYAFLTAKNLNAEYNVISQCGWGLKWSFDGKADHAIPPHYEKICGPVSDGQESWNFASWQPDVVIINLGTNDHSAIRDFYFEGGFECFEDAVVQFLCKLRACNPQSYLLYAYGMLGTEMLPAIQHALTQYQKETGDLNCGILELPATQQGEYGSRSHPGIQNHEKATNVLTGKLREILTDRVALLKE